MLELRSLIVVTGTVRVEGGESNTVQSRESNDKATNISVTLRRKITPDRRAANVITTDYMRKLRAISLLRTPYGVLVDPARLPDVKTLVRYIGRRIAEFNQQPRTCALSNCVLWERLEGNRLAAVAGWVEARAEAGDDEVRAVMAALRRTPEAA